MKRFISFEGIDGAGKSSHIAWLAGLLELQGHPVVCTREPGGTPLGEQLRALLLAHVSEAGRPMDVNTELMLMFAARRQHLTELIEPALANGKVVISDRFADSTFAFQGGGGRVPYHRIMELDHWCGGVRPELTFVFDLEVDVAMARIAGTRTLDRFETEERGYHERVRSAYLHRAALEPDRVRIINADRPIEVIRHELAEIVGLSVAAV